ncbi:Ig-like and fibronectin type-III domain-containing protein 2 isoform X2 [Cylas formicarius]|uniref:Ig-like and fibronectin type-III domain-containing protein 2 isoform X2 n=1 Tax=Cylas formicarius TaxID=197179 RepID=UPI0029588D41|nr:Ig-like and fibronectin type-III domain-containing protein 2 isoform X2 [Cylas formicarius]
MLIFFLSGIVFGLAHGEEPSTSTGLPSMRDSLTNPMHVYDGDDALITCVVRNIGSNTVMWKKEDRERHSTRVLTAGENRVTADKRFGVLHDSGNDGSSELPSGGDVWVLVIKNSRLTDSGIYVCEVNSNPIVRSFHKLSVLSKSMVPATNLTTDIIPFDDPKSIAVRNHNYTDCCVLQNVSSGCLGFCNIQSILEGITGQDPEHCEKDFPSIVKCMADGRNHVPCCIHERVPDICQDVCRGEYTAITENIKTHFSCSAYTEQTLACIVEGIQLLPSPPEDVEVDALTEKSIRVEWSRPRSNSQTITQYMANLTALRSFDENSDSFEDNTSGNNTVTTIIQSVPADQNSSVFNDLTPFTMYEVTVTAHNLVGSSLPSYAIRTLTLAPGQVKQTMVGHTPALPDIRSCCANKGITHKTCLTKLCDPIEAESVEITDMMICAPWAQDTFGCLTNGMDHTSCCRTRGLPEICQQLCTGNVSSIDFNYFKCLRYMGEYTNCLLQGYGVLPSAPTQVHISNVGTEYALLYWSAPKTLGDTVKSYNVHTMKVNSADEEEEENHRVINKAQSPFVIEGLESVTDYEVYVEAVNAHGVGNPSPRLIFRTGSKIEEEKIEEASLYNVTACCVEAQLNSVCLPLCTYDANMNDIKRLAVCGSEFHTILRCAAGGRNHGTCCSRRGVPPACLSLCSGVIVDSLRTTAANCVTYIGNIVQCFEEGTGTLPGPVTALHAISVDQASILLEWSPPEDGANVTDYVIHYQKVDNTSMYETLLKLDQQMNTTGTSTTLTGLEENATYHVFVVSRNHHGTSLPSSIVVIQPTKSDDTKWVNAVPSPPHSLAVASHSATWVTISWQPPEFSHPSEIITYRLYYKSTADETYQIKNVTVTTYMIKDLSPNTQYIIYVEASTDKGVSMPSETLIAWTDPAYPAFVEPPTVHPINLVIEGSSMTILCIAMGNPMPTISLYISGRLVRQDTTRHMVTVIHNVTRDMDQISCYADNGYGTPMQASRKIIISHKPNIQASGITMATIGDSVVLECKVEATPEPKLIFWKNYEDRMPVIQGGKYDVSISKAKDEDDKYVMHLTIKQITELDVGEYYCHAENAFGSATQPVSVRIRSLATITNVTQCCMEQNVSTPCMDACYFHLDIDAVIDKPECIKDFDKLMKCAADGSDHRNCCAHANVPRRCLDWCRGEPILSHKSCVLSHTKHIMNCFHELRDKLPGPPQNIRVEFVDSHSVYILWDPPLKNPHSVEMYRVFWRAVDSPNRSSQKGDTSETQLKISNLKDGTTYEAVIKAGNSKGTSTLTDPIKFTMGENSLYITPAASQSTEGSHVGVAVAVVLALAVVAIVIAAGVWFVRTRRMLGIKGSGGIAFENPSYLREVNMDHIQSQLNDSATALNGTANGSLAISAASGGPGWKNEPLHVPAAQEVNPTLYEELKLGQDGAGFKRLKP